MGIWCRWPGDWTIRRHKPVGQGGRSEMAGRDLEQVLKEDHEALEAFVRGDPEPKRRVYSREDDATLANPLGPPVRGWAEISKALDHASGLLRDGQVDGFD